ncbi:MAG TPA: hypothetical protein VNO22_00835 [Planctomycetota bacterium]|nr:hypothetical protein [Planctomycetota bacterium]
MDPSQWDGSDFFMIWPMPRYIFITEKVARLIQDEGWVGARIYPMEELKPCEGFAPGKRSYSMPEERAQKLRPKEGSART